MTRRPNTVEGGLLRLPFVLVRASSVTVAGQRDTLSLRGIWTLFGFLDGNELAGPAIAAPDPAVWFFGLHCCSCAREGKKLPPDLAWFRAIR